MTLLDDIRKTATEPAHDAHALPLAAYADVDVHALERTHVFHGDWVFVCNTFEISQPGDRFALDIAGEPVVVMRDADGQVRAMSNVCTHRGTPLADEGFSQGSRLVCPYHAWTFTDDGTLKGAPYVGNAPLDKKKHCLPQFACEVWNHLVFVNIDGAAAPLAERFAGLGEYLSPYGVDQFTGGYSFGKDTWRANWKLVMENAMESYHLFKVHKPTLETVAPTKLAYYVEGHAEWTVTAGATRQPAGWMSALARLWPEPSSDPEENRYVLFSMPPNLVGIASEDGFGYITCTPDGPGRSRVRGGNIGFTNAPPGGSTGKFVADFFDEDKRICERAQKGMSSSYARQSGQLVELERVVVDFHQYLASRLFGTTPDPIHRAPPVE